MWIRLHGIANAIDLADRSFLKLQSLNCEYLFITITLYIHTPLSVLLYMVLLHTGKPMVVSFRAYFIDQIIMILNQRLMALPYIVFQPQARELCTRGAIKMFETELRENACTSNLTSMVDHMAIALLRDYKSPIVDTIQSLPQHQQIVLCSAVKLFLRGKKDTTIGELNKYYIDLRKSTSIPPIGIIELSCMSRVLGDQARGSTLVASSLKILTRVKKTLVGTIRRGKTPKEDYMLENQLLHDEKQCAEHIMMVDLGRNDVGKVIGELLDEQST
nr:hypothetical protein [Tanacetum cinerariifolium]